MQHWFFRTLEPHTARGARDHLTDIGGDQQRVLHVDVLRLRILVGDQLEHFVADVTDQAIDERQRARREIEIEPLRLTGLLGPLGGSSHHFPRARVALGVLSVRHLATGGYSRLSAAECPGTTPYAILNGSSWPNIIRKT